MTGSLPARAAIDEITVTAQRREQNLQVVPLAVSAFDISQIETRQIDTVKDIGQNIPNLQTYTVTAGAQAIQVHSRGASVQNPGFNISESPVGIYLDDVYFGRLASVNLDLSDVERIEVLRGPQGTLYGRNTIAGAIKIITASATTKPPRSPAPLGGRSRKALWLRRFRPSMTNATKAGRTTRSPVPTPASTTTRLHAPSCTGTARKASMPYSPAGLRT
jgi:outer membrane receptor protein involved in Fe transport